MISSHALTTHPHTTILAHTHVPHTSACTAETRRRRTTPPPLFVSQTAYARQWFCITRCAQHARRQSHESTMTTTTGRQTDTRTHKRPDGTYIVYGTGSKSKINAHARTEHNFARATLTHTAKTSEIFLSARCQTRREMSVARVVGSRRFAIRRADLFTLPQQHPY